jgi:hypothetical protein
MSAVYTDVPLHSLVLEVQVILQLVVPLVHVLRG